MAKIKTEVRMNICELKKMKRSELIKLLLREREIVDILMRKIYDMREDVKND